jgi:hypothetical protein
MRCITEDLKVIIEHEVVIDHVHFVEHKTGIIIRVAGFEFRGDEQLQVESFERTQECITDTGIELCVRRKAVLVERGVFYIG